MSADVRLLELMAENAELRAQLAEAQEQCVELAVDAGELHAEIQTLRQELAEARAAHRFEPTRASEDRPGGPHASTDAIQPAGP